MTTTTARVLNCDSPTTSSRYYTQDIIVLHVNKHRQWVPRVRLSNVDSEKWMDNFGFKSFDISHHTITIQTSSVFSLRPLPVNIRSKYSNMLPNSYLELMAAMHLFNLPAAVDPFLGIPGPHH